jgi:hypothetical protein
MAINSETPQEAKNDFGITDKCSFCDGDAVAYWRARKAVEVCYNCSITVLPAMIADATLRGSPPYNNLLSDFIALWRKLQNDSPEDDEEIIDELLDRK